MEINMNVVTFDFRHPIGNILGRMALLGNVNPRGFVDWLVLSRASVNINPYFIMIDEWASFHLGEVPYHLFKSSVCGPIMGSTKGSPIAYLAARVLDAPQKWYDRLLKVYDYVASDFWKNRQRKWEAFVACDRSIAKDAFYDKNICIGHLESSGGVANLEVFAKLENSGRCTLDGHEEQVVVMCNQYGHTNSTRPEPGPDVSGEVRDRKNKCVDEGLGL
jgi:hypothetical protein